MQVTKKINTDKLKVKYVLGNYSMQRSYPDAEDVLYELIVDFCNSKRKRLTFTDIGIFEKYNVSMNDIHSWMNIFINSEFIKIHKQDKDKITYELIKNPYE